MFPVGMWQAKVKEFGPKGGYKGTFHVIFALTRGGVGDKVGMVFYTFLSLNEEDTKAAAILVLKEGTGDHITLREIGCDEKEGFLVNTGNANNSNITLRYDMNNPDSLTYEYKAPTNGRNGTGTLKKV